MKTNIFYVSELIDKKSFNSNVAKAICRKLSIINEVSVKINSVCYQNGDTTISQRFGINATVCNVLYTIMAKIDYLTGEICIDSCNLKSRIVA